MNKDPVVILKDKKSAKIFLNTQIYSLNLIYSACYANFTKSYFILDKKDKNIIVNIIKNSDSDIKKGISFLLDTLISMSFHCIKLKEAKDTNLLILKRLEY